MRIYRTLSDHPPTATYRTLSDHPPAATWPHTDGWPTATHTIGTTPSTWWTRKTAAT